MDRICNSWLLRPRLHEQIKRALFAQILAEQLHSDPKFEQILASLFASFIAQILDSYEVTLSEFAQINVALFAHVNKALTAMDSALFFPGIW